MKSKIISFKKYIKERRLYESEKWLLYKITGKGGYFKSLKKNKPERISRCVSKCINI